MRTKEIFNGRELVEVHEGSKFEMEGFWGCNVGTIVTFQVRRGVEVQSKVIEVTGTGTTFVVSEILTHDALSDMEVEATTVEPSDIEAIPHVETPKFNKAKFTKKELISFIEDNHIDIVYENKTKAEIVSELKELGAL